MKFKSFKIVKMCMIKIKFLARNFRSISVRSTLGKGEEFGSGSVLVTNGSGCESGRPKNIRTESGCGSGTLIITKCYRYAKCFVGKKDDVTRFRDTLRHSLRKQTSCNGKTNHIEQYYLSFFSPLNLSYFLWYLQKSENHLNLSEWCYVYPFPWIQCMNITDEIWDSFKRKNWHITHGRKLQ